MRLRCIVVVSVVSAIVAAGLGAVPGHAASGGGERPRTDVAGHTTDSVWRLNDDGTITRTFFGRATFRSRDGVWGVIDPTVRPTRDPVFPYAADDALRPVRFGATRDAIVRLRLDGGEITVAAPGLAIGTPTLTPDGGVLYRDVARDTDLRYDVTDAGVTERLVLRSPRAPRTFRFVVADPAGALGGLVGDASGAAQSARAVADGHRLNVGAPYAYEQRMGAATADTSAVTVSYRATLRATEIVKSVDARWLRGNAGLERCEGLGDRPRLYAAGRWLGDAVPRLDST